jgi:uncharacterized membrane protein YhdT
MNQWIIATGITLSCLYIVTSIIYASFALRAQRIINKGTPWYLDVTCLITNIVFFPCGMALAMKQLLKYVKDDYDGENFYDE